MPPLCEPYSQNHAFNCEAPDHGGSQKNMIRHDVWIMSFRHVICKPFIWMESNTKAMKLVDRRAHDGLERVYHGRDPNMFSIPLTSPVEEMLDAGS